MPFSTLVISFDSYCELPTAMHRWLMQCLARYANRDGRCWPTGRQLAKEARTSPATISRRLKEMAQLGCFTRERKPGRRYVYQLAEAYRPGWPGRGKSPDSARSESVSDTEQSVSELGNGTVSHAETQEVKPSKQSKKVKAHRPTLDNLQRSQWTARLRGWERSGGSFWLGYWGPKPGQPGCLVPPELLSAS